MAVLLRFANIASLINSVSYLNDSEFLNKSSESVIQ